MESVTIYFVLTAKTPASLTTEPKDGAAGPGLRSSSANRNPASVTPNGYLS